MQIRHATLDDLPAVAEVIIAALANDSSLHGLFPPGFRKNPAYEEYAHDVLKRYLSPENLDRLVLVLEVPHGGANVVASVAIWDMSHSRSQNPWGSSSSASSSSSLGDIEEPLPVMYNARSGSPVAKLTALSSAMAYSQRRHFSHLEPYVYLEVLATHPAHRGRGYAKALCAVGVAQAQRQDLTVAVLTSSRGYIFFSGLTFADHGAVSLRGGGYGYRDEDCVLKSMVLMAPATHKHKPRRRSNVFESLMAYVSPAGK